MDVRPARGTSPPGRRRQRRRRGGRKRLPRPPKRPAHASQPPCFTGCSDKQSSRSRPPPCPCPHCAVHPPFHAPQQRVRPCTVLAVFLTLLLAQSAGSIEGNNGVTVQRSDATAGCLGEQGRGRVSSSSSCGSADEVSPVSAALLILEFHNLNLSFVFFSNRQENHVWE